MFLYLSVKRSGLKCSCAINEAFAVLVIRAVDLLSEHAYCVAITFKMTERVEQQICLKFCVKLEHSPTETIQVIQKDFGDDAMNAAQIEVWHKGFKDGQESVESDPHSARPATNRTPANAESVPAAINKERRLKVQELEADQGIPNTTVCEILMQALGMKCVVAKFVLQLLLPEEKEHCVAVVNDLIQTTTNEPDFLKKVITRDELWAYGYGLEMKAQSLQWKSPVFHAERRRDKVAAYVDCVLLWKVVSVMSTHAPPDQTL
nr:protein GVQW3-like [Desmodus rotundus]XP_053776427.1 protein GVQW3-like [Desmodus rotundus]